MARYCSTPPLARTIKIPPSKTEKINLAIASTSPGNQNTPALRPSLRIMTNFSSLREAAQRASTLSR
jgi:hypothetical protein